jgi:uncharacterized protein with HEPN domain
LRDLRPRLDDILRSIAWIEQDVKGIRRATFVADRRLRQLVERNVEIISEATRHLPAELKSRHPDIPWREIAGIGNVLRHDYEEVVPGILWDVVRADLKPLKQAVRTLLREEERAHANPKARRAKRKPD